MASLTDLFNPTFLMFLGILVLVVALLVVYFETKFREQNHKISYMLSHVSYLAEEVNGYKMFINPKLINADSTDHSENAFLGKFLLRLFKYPSKFIQAKYSSKHP